MKEMSLHLQGYTGACPNNVHPARCHASSTPTDRADRGCSLCVFDDWQSVQMATRWYSCVSSSARMSRATLRKRPVTVSYDEWKISENFEQSLSVAYWQIMAAVCCVQWCLSRLRIRYQEVPGLLHRSFNVVSRAMML